jgi:hypothetical protein
MLSNELNQPNFFAEYNFDVKLKLSENLLNSPFSSSEIGIQKKLFQMPDLCVSKDYDSRLAFATTIL